jgi:hypothetical protein
MLFFKIRFSLSILIDALQKVPRLKNKKLTMSIEALYEIPNQQVSFFPWITI